MFSDDQLKIFDYNRVVKDLNGKSSEDFLQEISKIFAVEKLEEATHPGEKGQFSMYLDSQWFKLTPQKKVTSSNPKENLDVTFLSDEVLAPILGITDLRKDTRIDFVGGIRGLKELERRVTPEK